MPFLMNRTMCDHTFQLQLLFHKNKYDDDDEEEEGAEDMKNDDADNDDVTYYLHWFNECPSMMMTKTVWHTSQPQLLFQ